MLQMTIREALAKEPGIQEEPYCIYLFSDGETVLYVGQAVNPYNRFLSHMGLAYLGIPSQIGAFIIKFAPYSGNWLFSQYTLEECAPFVEAERATYLEDSQAFYRTQGNRYDVDDAEEALIHLHRPHFNIAANPNPSPLPAKYEYEPGTLFGIW